MDLKSFFAISDMTGLCAHSTCAPGSKCVNLNSKYICLCEEGKFYKENKCNEGESPL